MQNGIAGIPKRTVYKSYLDDKVFHGADWRAAVTDRHVITYVRVSTSQQGRSGLGIEAQRQVLKQFAASEGFTVAREYVEVETGKGSDALDRRPQLKAALAAARKHRCPVAVAKLDRLSRDLHFISVMAAAVFAFGG